MAFFKYGNRRDTSGTVDLTSIDSGNEAAPSIAYTGDQDTGVYRVGANSIGVTCGGAQQAIFNSSGVTIAGTANVTGDLTLDGGDLHLNAGSIYIDNETEDQILVSNGLGALVFENKPVEFDPTQHADGSVLAPSISFTNDQDSGMYLESDGVLAIAAAGSKKVEVTSTTVSLLAATTFLDGDLHVQDGDATTPGVAFGNDLDTGLYRIGANNIGISCGGTNALDLSSNRAVMVSDGSTASGAFSVAIGGSSNTSSGSYYSSVIGGYSNTASGISSACLGGQYNTASANRSICIGGENNAVSQVRSGSIAGRVHNVSGANSVAIGGETLTITGDSSVIAGGIVNSCSGGNAFIGGSNNSQANGNNSVCLGSSAVVNDVAGVVCLGGSSFTVSSAYPAAAAGDVVIENNLFASGNVTLATSDDNTPGVTFGTAGTGLFGGSTSVGMSVGGNAVVSCFADFVNVVQPMDIVSAKLTSYGAVDAPAITWDDSNTTGLYLVTDDTIGVSTAGVKRIEVSAATTEILNNLKVGSTTIVGGGAVSFTLPSADGTSGQVLSTNGSGVLSFVDGGGGGLDINGLTADSAPIRSTDYVATYDDSAAGNKKVLLSKLSNLKTVTCRATNNQSISDGVHTTMQFSGTNTNDDTSYYTVTTGAGSKITVLKTGTYLVHYNVVLHGVSSVDYETSVVLNGTTDADKISFGKVEAGSETWTTKTEVFRLTANDYLQVRVMQNSGSSKNSNSQFGEYPAQELRLSVVCLSE